MEGRHRGHRTKKKTEQTNIFFKLMEERYNRFPTILTTNLDDPAWASI